MADAENKVSIEEFFQHHLSYRWKIGLVAFLLVCLVASSLFIYDLRRRLADQEVKSATLSQNFQQLGDSAVSKNEFNTQKQAVAKALDVQGKSVQDFAKENSLVLKSITESMGQIRNSVSGIQGKLSATDLSAHQDKDTGALTGFNMTEVRPLVDGKPLPPLTSLKLFYNPAKRNPDEAFAGTTWNHNQEKFLMSFGQWQSSKDHGFKTTVSLKRTVYAPDPLNPGNMVSLGEESIPLGESSTIFTPEGLQTIAPQVPRWTALLGVTKKASTLPSTSYSPFGAVDFRFTNRYGAFAGVQSSGPVFGISVRFGAPK